VRGLADVRSVYIPLGFGYRWEIYKAETEAQRAARIRRENREAIRRARRRGDGADLTDEEIEDLLDVALGGDDGRQLPNLP
jgi:hypothetical protein